MLSYGMSPEHHNAGWKLNGLDTSWLVCLPTIALVYITPSLLAYITTTMQCVCSIFHLLFVKSTFEKSQKQPEDSNSAPPKTKARSVARRPASGARHAASGRGARSARAATAYTMHDYAKYFDCTASPSIPYIHTYCMCTSYIHATYILHRTHIYKNGKQEIDEVNML